MLNEGQENQNSAVNSDQGTQDSSDKNEIDIQSLAEKVYDLLKKEMRIERERRGWTGKW